MAHNPLNAYLLSEHSNTMVCTSAGVIGGITKAVVTPHLLNITFNGGFTVVTYAALSSIAAYLAKETISWLHKKAKLCFAKWKAREVVR
ncbi:MAG: hypothetical protein JST27_04885 [Bacteroidetes bacterium]|nr:hypothetical protein [Bacteroidota bacterium]